MHTSSVFVVAFGLVAALSHGQLCWTPTPLAAGDGPAFLVASDLDGDGLPDLVVANQLSNDVSIFQSLGNGEFAPEVRIEVGDAPRALFASDLDGDGTPDLAVTSQGNDQVLVLLNQGDARFGAPQPFGVGDQPLAVAAADLDGDGDADLVTANRGSDDVSVLLNNGDGSFADHVSFAAGTDPRSVDAADLNADGLADLVVANQGSNDASVLINTGNATFAPEVRYNMDNGPASIVAEDLDGDGDADIAVANGATFTVSVRLNDGTGVFGAEHAFAAGDAASSVFASDLDGDGDADLAVANRLSDDLSVLTNDGAGSFDETQRITPLVYPVGDVGPASILAADLDGDGDADLASANFDADSISVLPNNGAGVFPSMVVWEQLPEVNLVAIIDQDFPDIAEFSSYQVCDIVVEDEGWILDSVTSYFTIGADGCDCWPGEGDAMLNVFPKVGTLPLPEDDPTAGTVVPVAFTNVTRSTKAMMASGLGIRLAPGEYWVGLTPIFDEMFGQEFHLGAASPIGEASAWRNPGDGFGYGASWFKAGALFGFPGWDAAITLYGVTDPCGDACPADCDKSGSLNILDFVCFQNEWTAQRDRGDCDGNGQYNILDFVCFQNLYSAGCD